MTQQAQWVSPRSESWRYSAAAISKWEHHLWVSGEAPSVQADQPVAVTPIDHASFRAAFDDVVAGLPSFDQQTPFDMSAAIAGHLFPHQALLGDGHAIRINASTDDTRARGANDDGSASGVLEVHLTLPASAEWSGNARTENAGTKNARTENARTENAGIKNARTENAGIKNVRTENTHTENPNTEVAATQTGEQSPGEQISLAVRHNLMITIGRDDRATRREATGEPGEPVEHRVRLFLHSESAVWDQQSFLMLLVEDGIHVDVVRSWDAAALSHPTGNLWSDLIILPADATCNSYVALGGAHNAALAETQPLIRHASVVALTAPGASTTQHTRIRCVHRPCHLESSHHIFHLAPQTSSDHATIGLAANGQKLFNLPKVSVARNATGSDAAQSTRFVVTPADPADAKNEQTKAGRTAPTTIAKPSLDIRHSDVECTHGVAIGGIDHAQLRYLRHRGMSEARATLLLEQAMLTKDLPSFLTATASPWLDCLGLAGSEHHAPTSLPNA